MSKGQIPDQVYDILIVGGGPAGLTAGLYAARASLKALLIEGATSVSQITVTDMIENYPGIPEGISGFELIERFKKQAVQFGLEITGGDVHSIARKRLGDTDGWEVIAGNSAYDALAVIVATGTNWRKLGVPGEETLVGKGVSYCATCDGPLYRNKDVVVIGGGDAAVQEAIFLANFARKVTIVHRRDRLRATGILQRRALANAKIEFAWNSVVEEISGKEFVTGVKIRDVKSSGTLRDIPADGVFIFIGLTPNTGVVRGIVDLDKNGYIVVDSHMKTSAEGIFACGDCIVKLLRQVITASGDGATAAFSTQLYVEAVKGKSY
ncbi:MAG: thioredoxin-disulfide reductase [Syntrophales bacterium]|nr:thioredoxin-disulfide reductase [Syntrophales bacterium]